MPICYSPPPGASPKSVENIIGPSVDLGEAPVHILNVNSLISLSQQKERL
jgi:hypothetical protein